MSSGWSTLVKPPGMMAGLELKTFHDVRLHTVHHKQGFVCPEEARKHSEAQMFIISWSIHPFSFTATTPKGDWLFGMVFCLKMSTDGSFDPFPQHASTTVKCGFT